MATDAEFPSDEQIANGLHLCFRNAEALRTEAELLYTSNYKARAFALLVLSLEELGKIPLLFDGLRLRRTAGADPKSFWRSLRNHTNKQAVWVVYGSHLTAAKARDATYFRKKLPEGIGKALDVVKQRCFYTDFADGQFEDPVAFVNANPDLYPWLIELLDARLTSFRTLHGELAFSKAMVQAYVRQSDPSTRTEEDRQHLALLKSLGINLFN
jgi:AbiV family abortive infection protein